MHIRTVKFNLTSISTLPLGFFFSFGDYLKENLNMYMHILKPGFDQIRLSAFLIVCVCVFVLVCVCNYRLDCFLLTLPMVLFTVWCCTIKPQLVYNEVACPVCGVQASSFHLLSLCACVCARAHVCMYYWWFLICIYYYKLLFLLSSIKASLILHVCVFKFKVFVVICTKKPYWRCTLYI